MALFRSLWLRYIRRDPLGFQGQVKEDTHFVGWITGVMTLSVTILSRVFLIWSEHSIGTFLWACWTGGTEGWVLMV